MKMFTGLLFIVIIHVGYGQDKFDKVNDRYEFFLERINVKDTLLKNRTKYYKCGEDISGRIEYYYEKDELKLMMHIYKQGFGNNSFLENYFIQNDSLRLKTVISEEIFFNTLYKESSQGVSSTSVEKVVEITEQRMLFKEDDVPACIERRHGAILSEWDQGYFDSLAFDKGACIENKEDILYKYRLLRKAEKKLESYSNRNPKCIFHIW
ncbi:hypothetical protein [Aquimarina litoralis]